MKSQKRKLVITMFVMTIFYTTVIVVYFIPKPPSELIVNKITTLIEDIKVEWPLSFF
jgi:hypothetical protein